MNPVAARSVDFSDVQGLVRFGYVHLTEGCYYLLRVSDAARARSWLRGAPVADAVERKPSPSEAMQIAFTATGLLALGVPPDVVAAFSAEFVGGMSGDESRSRRLGDVGANAPANWRWGGAGAVPHLTVMLFAQPGGLAALEARCTAEWAGAFEILGRLDTSNLGGVEQFGFTDGVSQPALDWNRQRDPAGDQLGYSNVVALGEFLLGYPNEYGKYTERPLLDDTAAAAELAPAEDVPAKRDLGCNGTYVVLRQLRQDVRGFWQFAARHSGGDATQAVTLAANFVGRTQDGAPLVAGGATTIPGIGPKPADIALNGFTFDDDPDGVRCPKGAHVRRSNPRNADLPRPPANVLAQLIATLGLGPHRFGEDLTSSTRFHRLLRRGREYGPGLPAVDALQPAPPDDAERGLQFVCVGANIGRQFEFLQNAWLMSTKFDGLSGESDPLMGNRQPIPGCPVAAGFSMPREGTVQRRFDDLPQFVTVLGGAYFFMPGLRALRYIAGASV